MLLFEANAGKEDHPFFVVGNDPKRKPTPSWSQDAISWKFH